MPETVDAVVIGAGHNGLVAANLLADAGWEVVVFESTAAAGGAVQSGEITAPGYLSDLCSAFYPLAPASALARLGLEDHGLEWTHAPAVAAYSFPDGRSVVLSRDLERTADSVGAFAPGDAAAWKRIYAEWQKVSGPLMDGLMAPFPPVRGALRLARRSSVGDLVRFARLFLLPVRVLGEEWFEGEGGRALLTCLALHTDLSPEQTASAAYGWLLAMLGQEFGYPVPVGGAQAITDALVSRLRARGGRLLLNTPVTKVVVGGGKALGVAAADGRLFRARRAVLADVAAPTLYKDLVGADHLPSRLVDDLDRFKWDHSTIKVDWALSGPVPWANPDLGESACVHLGGDLAGMSRYAVALDSGQVPETPFLLSGQMTTADRSRSPEGTEVMWAYTHIPRSHEWTAEEVRKHAERIEATVEAHAPGFRDLVVARHVAGPDDLQRHNPSLLGGAVNGGTAAAFQQLIFRPVPGLGRADTVIDRLYLASAGAHPGGGVHGGPGSNAARAALARWRPVLGDLYAAGIRAAHRTLY